ncbi:MAG TPA: DUF5719 family protein [Mycobacteriales bacterium]|nr:DUF5719 family protein [Mycobacteriales bacterium]
MSRLPALLVVGLLAIGVAAGEATRADSPGRTGLQTARVVGAVAVCPDLRQDGSDLVTRISAGVAPTDPADSASSEFGDLLGQPLRSKGQPATLPVRRPGEVAVDLGSSISGDALVVTARGPLAAGLELEQVTRGEEGPDRGLAGLRCEAPRTDSWFLGGATVVGDAAVLVLVNSDATPATVDVSVWSSTGPVPGRPGRGLIVAPRSRLVVPVERLAPDRDLLALRVKAQRGRVSAALRHVRDDGRTPRGVEWVPQALPPATEVVVAGFPAGPGRRHLLLANPGPDETVVSLELTTEQDQAVPLELEAVHVPRGSTVAVDLTSATAQTPMAVRVASVGGPVLASGYVYDAQTGPVREISYAPSTLPLSGPALLTDLVINRPTESTLLLSALDQAATVEVTPVAIVGQVGELPEPKRVDVPAGRTVALRLSTFFPPGATGRLALDVRTAPGSGPVHAARYLRERGSRGPLTTILGLRGPAPLVPRPLVRRDAGGWTTVR